MSDTVVMDQRPNPKPAEPQRKAVRKSQPPSYPYRITFCVAPDQKETLGQVTRAYRASEAFVLRMALDQFARSNGFPVNINGGTNVVR